MYLLDMSHAHHEIRLLEQGSLPRLDEHVD